MIVDRGVDVVEPHTGGGMPEASVGAPTAARWDPPQLLDVDVDQLARLLALIATDDTAGGAIHPAQSAQLLTYQHAMHGRRGHVQADREPHGTELGPSPQHLDLALHSRRRSPWAAQWSRAPVVQTRLAFLHVAPPPLVRGRTRDPHLARDVCRGAPLSDPLDQNQPANRGEYRLRMGHGSLRL